MLRFSTTYMKQVPFPLPIPAIHALIPHAAHRLYKTSTDALLLCQTFVRNSL